MFINDECIDISNDIMETVAEVGIVIQLKTVLPTTIVADEQDLYAKYYKQTKNDSPLIDKTYNINAVLNYNPAEDVLKNAGLDEKCSVVVMLATYELIKVGMFTLTNEISEIITELKRGKIIEVNGKTFIIKNVGMTGILNGFPNVCNLGCDVYA